MSRVGGGVSGGTPPRRPRAVPDVPAHDDELERSYLGAVIFRPALLDEQPMVEECFFRESHRLVFAAAVALHLRGQDVNSLTLRAELEDAQAFAAVGNDALLGLTDRQPIPHVTYARLWRLARVRQLEHASFRLAATLRANEDPSDAFAQVARAKDLLDQLDQGAAFPELASVVEGMVFDPRRMLTGLDTLDTATRGGLPMRKIVALLGPPGVAKTTVATCLLDGFTQQGAYGVYVAADEPREGIATRLGQLQGFERDALESPHDVARRRFAEQLRRERPGLVVLDPRRDRLMLEDVARRLFTAAAGRVPVLVVDSLQTVPCAAFLDGGTHRDRVECVLDVLESIASKGALVIAISEMNRASYKTGVVGQEQDTLAGGKDSSRIEYGVDLQLTLSPVKGEPDAIRIRIDKNRIGGSKPELRILLNRARASVREVGVPDAEQTDAQRDAIEEKKAAARLELSKERIRKTVVTSQVKSQREILDRTVGKQNELSRAVRLMIQSGELVQDADGVFRLHLGGPACAE